MRFYEEVQQRIADISAIVNQIKNYAQVLKSNIETLIEDNLHRESLDATIVTLATITRYLDGVGYSFQPSNSIGIDTKDILVTLTHFKDYLEDVDNIMEVNFTSKDCELFNTKIRKIQSMLEKYRSSIVEEGEVLTELAIYRKYPKKLNSLPIRRMILEELNPEEALYKSTRDYVDYLLQHKDNVINAYLDQLCNLHDEFIDSHKFEILYLVAKHDMSKYEEIEFEPYRIHYNPTQVGENELPENIKAYENAWMHHKVNNPHHWEYWLEDNGELTEITDMELRKMYAVEMLADWTSMSMYYQNEPIDWYNEHKSEIKLHPEIREYVEEILPKLHK